MKKFLINTLWFSTVLLLLLVIKNSILPYYVGNPLYAKKIEFVERKNMDYNTAAFGSSRIYRQFNTLLLDSLLKEKGVNSFNFASTATFNPESYVLYKNFIEDIKFNKIKYAFLEIQSLNRLTKKNAESLKGSYWNSLSIFNYSNNYINQSFYFKDADEKRKAQKANYFSSFLHNFLNFKIIEELSNDYSKATFGKRKGFYPLEVASADAKKDFLEKRHQKFLQDTTKLTNRVRASKNRFNVIKNAEINEAHLDFLKDLISSSKEKGTHLFLVIPPRLVPHEYAEIIPLINKLPSNNVISLCGYEEYKALYLVKNSFDLGHLNNKGSEIFTTSLAEKTLKILNSN